MSINCHSGFYGNEVVFCKTRYIVAKKAHQCIECGQRIPKGTQYQKQSGCWRDPESEEKAFGTYKTCTHCAKVAQNLLDEGYCLVIGRLWEFVEKFIDDDSELMDR